mmetsp:Transcript_35279/g.75157  ORF Transcript_35279/g.75157 Transcript_35279/m.75157 type:complete len:104 (+) Transcript_35279:1590-1901(+)
MQLAAAPVAKSAMLLEALGWPDPAMPSMAALSSGPVRKFTKEAIKSAPAPAKSTGASPRRWAAIHLSPARASPPLEGLLDGAGAMLSLAPDGLMIQDDLDVDD